MQLLIWLIGLLLLLLKWIQILFCDIKLIWSCIAAPMRLFMPELICVLFSIETQAVFVLRIIWRRNYRSLRSCNILQYIAITYFWAILYRINDIVYTVTHHITFLFFILTDFVKVRIFIISWPKHFRVIAPYVTFTSIWFIMRTKTFLEITAYAQVLLLALLKVDFASRNLIKRR